MMSRSSDISLEVLAVRDRMIRGEGISWEELVSWTQSGNVELEGAAFQALTANETRVVGSIDAGIANEFILRHLLAAISREATPARVFVVEPYIAAHGIAAMYKQVRLQESSPLEGAGAAQRLLENTRDELARLYISGDAGQKKRVVIGVLEHILEEPVCRNDFDGWKVNPELRRALSEALEWSEYS